MSTVSKTKVDIDVDIDRLVGELRVKLKDPYLGRAFVSKALSKLQQHELYSIAEFALREGNHPGRLFVAVCSKAIRSKV